MHLRQWGHGSYARGWLTDASEPQVEGKTGEIGRMHNLSFRKIFLLGAGAIGSCYGALLSRKNEVTLIGREEHVGAINARGLVMAGDVEGEFHMGATTRIPEVPPNSLIILTTKAQDVVEAVAGVRPLLGQGVTLLALQNGLGIKELVQGALGGRAEVVRGLTMMAAESLGPGRVRFWNGPTIVEGTEAGEEVRALFEESGLRCRIPPDMRREEWRKLAINCVVNPLTAIFGVRNNEIGSPALKDIRHGVVQECLLVAAAEGVNLSRGIEKEVDRIIRGYTNYSSMCQDIAKGKRTEIAFLNGKVVELGRQHGIGTPVNDMLVGLIRFLEARK